MSRFLALLLITAQLVTRRTAEATKGSHQLQRDIPDALQIFENFPYGVAIMDTDGDGQFECLTAKRKEFNPEAKTATYIWSLGNGEGQKRKHAAFYHTVGVTPDATNFTVGKHSNKIEVGYFRYSDYKSCTVMEVPHYSNQCILWVAKEVENAVPTHCLQHFDDICGVGINVHDSDICVDDEDDSENDN